MEIFYRMLAALKAHPKKTKRLTETIDRAEKVANNYQIAEKYLQDFPDSADAQLNFAQQRGWFKMLRATIVSYFRGIGGKWQ